MSWSEWMARDWYKDYKTTLKRSKSNRNISCAYKPQGSYQLDDDYCAHIITTVTLQNGETLEDENATLLVVGSPGPTTDWIYKVYIAQVKFKEGRESEVEMV